METIPEEKSTPKKRVEKAPIPPRGTAAERQITEIEDALMEKAGQLSGILSGPLPVTSAYMGDRSPKAVKALLNIAKKNPKFLAGLQKASVGIDVLELGQFIAGIAVALQVDMQRLNGDEPVARSLGVTKVMEEYEFFEPDPGVNPAVTVQAPRFVAV